LESFIGRDADLWLNGGPAQAGTGGMLSESTKREPLANTSEPEARLHEIDRFTRGHHAAEPAHDKSSRRRAFSTVSGQLFGLIWNQSVVIEDRPANSSEQTRGVSRKGTTLAAFESTRNVPCDNGDAIRRSSWGQFTK
jgi:hypothetical protein